MNKRTDYFRFYKRKQRQTIKNTSICPVCIKRLKEKNKHACIKCLEYNRNYQNLKRSKANV